MVEWEGKMADATVDSWKDEFALVVLLAPAILVFIPGMREYVQSGFEVLATLPDWYQYLLYIAISASFGIKGVGQAAKDVKEKMTVINKALTFFKCMVVMLSYNLLKMV